MKWLKLSGRDMTNKRKLLLADASKVVRASLARQLADHFALHEEASGESAWQSLVLDSAIVAVVSNSFSEADRQDALARGVTDFVIKGATSPSVDNIVSALLEYRGDATEVN